jgi:uncharacterized membrane protein YuzA (DUF378 family)
MFWTPTADVKLHKAAMLVRAARELKALTDQDLIDREYIVKAVRGALTGRVTYSDAANSAIAEAMTRNTAELVGLLDEVVLRAVRQCGTEQPPDPNAVPLSPAFNPDAASVRPCRTPPGRLLAPAFIKKGPIVAVITHSPFKTGTGVNSLSTLNWIAWALLIIGALNGGIYGLFHTDVIAAIFPDASTLGRAAYVLVGAAGLYFLTVPFQPEFDDDE